MPGAPYSYSHETEVSIHAPRCRGAMLQRLLALGMEVIVSIHAPRCRGAMHCCRLHRRGEIIVFQSTPPVAEGRCRQGGVLLPDRQGFNPRPPLPRGDARKTLAAIEAWIVSIHAPRCRGAMPAHLSLIHI